MIDGGMDNISKQTIGNRIRELRKKNNMTLDALSELIGLEPNSLGTIERKDIIPRYRNIQKLCNILNVSQYYLFTGKDDIPNLEKLISIANNLDETHDNLIGKILYEYRTQMGYSLRELGHITGISYSYLQKLEHGHDKRTGKKIYPTILVLKQIASAFDIPLRDFLKICRYGSK